MGDKIAKPVMFWIPGDCFLYGSERDDRELLDFLKHGANIEIYVLEFNRRSWEESVETILDILRDLNLSFFLGGVDSGAMIAHEIANRLKKPAFLFSPVLKPFNRHDSLHETEKVDQLLYFKSLKNMKKIQDEILPPNSSREIVSTNYNDSVYSVLEDWINISDKISVQILYNCENIRKFPPFQTCLACVQKLAKNC